MADNSQLPSRPGPRVPRQVHLARLSLALRLHRGLRLMSSPLTLATALLTGAEREIVRPGMPELAAGACVLAAATLALAVYAMSAPARALPPRGPGARLWTRMHAQLAVPATLGSALVWAPGSPWSLTSPLISGLTRQTPLMDLHTQRLPLAGWLPAAVMVLATAAFSLSAALARRIAEPRRALLLPLAARQDEDYSRASAAVTFVAGLLTAALVPAVAGAGLACLHLLTPSPSSGPAPESARAWETYAGMAPGPVVIEIALDQPARYRLYGTLRADGRIALDRFAALSETSDLTTTTGPLTGSAATIDLLAWITGDAVREEFPDADFPIVAAPGANPRNPGAPRAGADLVAVQLREALAVAAPLVRARSGLPVRLTDASAWTRLLGSLTSNATPRASWAQITGTVAPGGCIAAAAADYTPASAATALSGAGSADAATRAQAVAAMAKTHSPVKGWSAHAQEQAAQTWLPATAGRLDFCVGGGHVQGLKVPVSVPGVRGWVSVTSRRISAPERALSVPVAEHVSRGELDPAAFTVKG